MMQFPRFFLNARYGVLTGLLEGVLNRGKLNHGDFLEPLNLILRARRTMIVHGSLRGLGGAIRCVKGNFIGDAGALVCCACTSY